MESQINITINSVTVKILLIIYAILLATILLVKGDMFMPMVFAAMGFGIVLWIIIFADIYNNKIYNKTFWIWSMFVFSTVAIFVYPFMRSMLIRLAEKHPNRG